MIVLEYIYIWFKPLHRCPLLHPTSRLHTTWFNPTVGLILFRFKLATLCHSLRFKHFALCPRHEKGVLFYVLVQRDVKTEIKFREISKCDDSGDTVTFDVQHVVPLVAALRDQRPSRHSQRENFWSSEKHSWPNFSQHDIRCQCTFTSPDVNFF